MITKKEARASFLCFCLVKLAKNLSNDINKQNPP